MTGYRIRPATPGDVAALVAMLADDPLGASERGTGLGTRLVSWAIGESRARGCQMVQLTSDASRTEAHRFYQRLGFVPSHVGFKLPL